MIVEMRKHCQSFAENKDEAKYIREKIIIPFLKKSEKKLIIDFSQIESTTQSFMHALLSKIFKDEGDKLLDKIVFRDCNPAIRSVITTVINYTL